MKRLALVLMIITLGLVPACGGKTPPQIPSVATLDAKTDKEFRDYEMYAYGVLQAAGKVENDASKVRASLDGTVPLNVMQPLKAAMAETDKAALKLIEDIDAKRITTTAQLKARLDPIVQGINTVQQLAKPTGHPKLLALVDVAAEIAAGLLAAHTGVGGLR